MCGDVKENLKDVYNRYATDRNQADRPDWKNKEREYALQAFQENECKRLLEIGAGTGQDSIFFQENGFEVQAIDLSEEHVRCCRQNGLTAAVMDLHNMTYKSDSFDCIYSMNCFMHIPKNALRSALEEAKRVVKPDGLLYMGVYGGKDFEGHLKKDYYEDERFFSFYCFNDYIRILEQFYVVQDARQIQLSDEVMFHAFLLKNE